jgi:hypothetical protein
MEADELLELEFLFYIQVDGMVSSFNIFRKWLWISVAVQLIFKFIAQVHLRALSENLVYESGVTSMKINLKAI